MRNPGNTCLVVAGCCSVCIALLHAAVTIGGGDWYRLMVPGEPMAVMAEAGPWFPIMFTTAVIVIFLLFGLYAFSGAGLIRRLPFTTGALILISCVYLTRGVGTIPLILFVEQPYLSDMNTRIGFVFVSSVFSLIIGVLYGIGTLSHGLNGDGTKSHDT